jgi:hypothetical protein
MTPYRPWGHWSAEDLLLLRTRRREGVSFRKIAKEIGRKRDAVASKWHEISGEPDTKPAVRPPSLAMVERDRRLAADCRDLTAALMGDPPVGYSALDRRSA